MYRIYAPETYLYVTNWMEKDKEALSVFRSLQIKDLCEVANCKLNLDFCPKYWEYDLYEKRFKLYGLSYIDMAVIKNKLKERDVEFMVCINKRKKTSEGELKDKQIYINLKRKKKGYKKYE